ncbi:hypothetical protein BUALT_Bualt10G0069300 [Buddleja alternifolia]|uniref:Uncharacterized protein n=1 Tax=Buddleja alternifolia TaxID=168488 RepID=A0AAV6X4U1_9LAMI|nr:hypothetical protein BUALT_Bualt10G0069300 [Buddleja alternifolia]
MVNLIMELAYNCNIEATHIDSSGVIIWDVKIEVNHQSIVDTFNELVILKNSDQKCTRMMFKGHEDNVEDIQFNTSSPQEFYSVGDDFGLNINSLGIFI